MKLYKRAKEAIAESENGVTFWESGDVWVMFLGGRPLTDIRWQGEHIGEHKRPKTK